MNGPVHAEEIAQDVHVRQVLLMSLSAPSATSAWT
jgi:hypothetical protein